jgi:hypothetical protein
LATLLGTCPICNKHSIKLVKHHWFDDESLSVGHIRLICYNCNSLLKSNERNHILPNWETQIEMIHNYHSMIESTNTITKPAFISKRPRVIVPVSMPPTLKARIDRIARISGTNRNHWIASALHRNAFHSIPNVDKPKGHNMAHKLIKEK